MRHVTHWKSIGARPHASIAAGLALCLAAAIAGCNRGGQKPPAMPPPQVTVARPSPDKATDFEEFTGHFEAIKSVTVQAMVSGRLEKVLFTEGAMVKENQPLFLIDPVVYQAQYEQSVANVALARAHLNRLEADLRRAKALLPTNAISQEDYDKAEGDRNEAAATVNVALANQNSAKDNLEYTTVRAKFAGRISRQMIDPGNMVKANDTPLTTLVSTDKMYIYFDVDERTTIDIRKLMDAGKIDSTEKGTIAVNYALAEEQGFPRSANVNFVDNQINMATGTWRLRALIDKPDACILPNMFVRVQVPVSKPYDTLFVPERALGSDQGQKYLLVIDGENKAVRRQVTCGPLRGDLRAILSGVSAGERVVVNGLQRVRPGDTVNPQEADTKKDEKKEAAKKDKQLAEKAEATVTPVSKR